MAYRYSKKTSRMEPVATFSSGAWKVAVGVSFQKTDVSYVDGDESGVIDKLSLPFNAPTTENLLPSSFTAETTFGDLISLNGKVIKAVERSDLLAPEFASLTPLTTALELSTWTNVGDVNKFKITSLASRVKSLPVDSLAFRLPVAPIKPDSVQILATLAEESGGDSLNLRFNSQGVLDSPLAQGRVNYQTGLVTLRFIKRIDITGTSKGYKLASGSSSSSSGTSAGSGSSSSTQYSYNRTYEYWGVEHEGDLYNGLPTEVDIGGSRIYGYEPLLALAETIRYNAVGYTFLPLDKDILGVDTVKLPPSGKVPAYRKGDLILVKAEKIVPLPSTTLDTPHSLGKSRLSLIEVVDSLGVKVGYDKYDIDLDAGTVTFKTGFKETDYLAPFSAIYHYQDMAVASDVSISGEIKLTKQLTHDFEPEDTLVSSALLMGTMQARVYGLFTQDVWKNQFLDYRDGADSIFKYDTSVAPIEVTNESCIQEEWAIVFTNTTSFDLIGKNVGRVASGSTLEDFTPLNPVTNRPFMTLKKEGFSTGAKVGNVLRFNTNAANFPIWVVRTILQSNATNLDHHFSLEFKGNKDRVL